MASLPVSEILRQAWRFLAFLVSTFVRSLRENLGMGLLALVLSGSIWVFITNEQNPPRTDVFPTRVEVHPVNVPAELDVLGAPVTVVLKITARTDKWSDLSEASFRAEVDLATLKEGTSEVPVHVIATDTGVQIVEVVPAEVSIELDRTAQQVVPVRVNLQQGPPLGFSSEDPNAEPEQVTVLGPESRVSLVDAAVVDVNLGDLRSTFRQSLRLMPRTARGYDITGVRLEPPNVVVEVPIIRQIDHINLPVTPALLGFPLPGYWVSEVQTSPATVTVVGLSEALASLETVRTEPIDVDNAPASFSRTVGLDLPQGVTLAERILVVVEIAVEPIQGTVVFRVAPQLVGVPSGLIAQVETPSVEVVLHGAGPSLRVLTVDSLLLFVNLAGREPGSHLIEPELSVPSGIRLARMTPEQVRVIITGEREPEGS